MKKELTSEFSDVKFQAFGKWIQVKLVEKQSKKTKGGLSRPDSDEDQQKSAGKVVSVGSEVSGVNVGETLLFGVYAGEEVDSEEKGKKVKYQFILEEDIISYVR